MRRARFAVLALTFAFALVAAARARAGEGVGADRPDLAEGPTALAPRTVQVEAGTTRSWLGRSAIGHETLDGIGELLVRVGVARGWEARVVLPSWYRETRARSASDPAGPSALERTGFGDPAVGLKRDLPSPRAGVAMGVLAEVSLPVGEEPFGGGDAAFGMTFAASHASSPGDLCGNIALGRSGDATLLLLTAAFERELVDRLAGFAEIAWHDEGGVAASMTSGGLLWLVTDRLQLDARVGAEFANGASDPLFGFGLARRW